MGYHSKKAMLVITPKRHVGYHSKKAILVLLIITPEHNLIDYHSKMAFLIITPKVYTCSSYHRFLLIITLKWLYLSSHKKDILIIIADVHKVYLSSSCITWLHPNTQIQDALKWLWIIVLIEWGAPTFMGLSNIISLKCSKS